MGRSSLSLAKARQIKNGLSYGSWYLAIVDTEGALVIDKKELVNHKTETASVIINVKDFPEHGVYLIGPSSPSFAQMAAQLIKGNEYSVTDFPPYSVFLRNTSSHSVVGYRLTWECVDNKGDAALNDVSNIISYLFYTETNQSEIRLWLAKQE